MTALPACAGERWARRLPAGRSRRLFTTWVVKKSPYRAVLSFEPVSIGELSRPSPKLKLVRRSIGRRVLVVIALLCDRCGLRLRGLVQINRVPTMTLPRTLISRCCLDARCRPGIAGALRRARGPGTWAAESVGIRGCGFGSRRNLRGTRRNRGAQRNSLCPCAQNVQPPPEGR